MRELLADRGHDGSGYERYFTEQIWQAKSAWGQGAGHSALQTWRAMRARFPELCLLSRPAFDLVLDLGLYDEAEALVREGRLRFPRHKELYEAIYVLTALRRGDSEETLRRCEALRGTLPKVAEGYTAAATCLGELGRWDEAELIIGLGTRKMPNSSHMFVRYAQLAEQRRDWTEALQRFNLAAKRFDVTVGFLGAAKCLKEMGRLDEATNLLAKTSERLARDPWPLAELASLAEFKGEFDEAARAWETLLKRFPSFDHGYLKGAAAMRKAGREAEGDELLRIAVRRSPTELIPNLEYARNAHRRRDWAAATVRWAAVLTRFPDCGEAQEREREALAALEKQSAGLSDLVARTEQSL